MAELSCDVLVAGAGPTGLMLANWLVRLGADVMVVDGKEGPTRESRALVVQARSLEIYDQLGLADQVLGAARRADAIAPGFADRAFGRIPLGPLGGELTPYPYIEVLEQSRNEEILYDNLQKLGAGVRWETPVTAVSQTDEGVEVKAGNDTVRARFCVGCDGANSVIRRARRIEFEGITNPHRFYVIDALGVGGLVENAINVRPGGADFLLAFPMEGRNAWRLLGLVRDADGDGQFTEEDVRPRLRDFAVTYSESRWFATYRVHHRIATTFRDGPFFLAGDAAHVHSPVGGQGMNTGLQDAHNLAFKLADVLHGRRRDAWLDRYEAERCPVARTLVGTTDRVFGAITSQGPVARALRRAVVPLLAPVGVRFVPRAPGGSTLFQYVSQIRIHYWMTPNARAAAGGRRDPVVGRRLPWTGENFAVLRDLRWQIHAYGGVEASAVPDLGVAVHVFPPAPATGLRPGTLYLVRPDGFVAAEAAPAEAAGVFPALMSG
ncbi:FAD-dependent monooxygenase [Actinoplanes sp. URMC 104]|uniref:FAD-dependent monooxygenase n=1 Tax=Actinoplanes sp. URMC 104 TaxID=3423409 RepID=UPI003F1B42EE